VEEAAAAEAVVAAAAGVTREIGVSSVQPAGRARAW
jgi:hypothetical protein